MPTSVVAELTTYIYSTLIPTPEHEESLDSHKQEHKHSKPTDNIHNSLGGGKTPDRDQLRIWLNIELAHSHTQLQPLAVAHAHHQIGHLQHN